MNKKKIVNKSYAIVLLLGTLLLILSGCGGTLSDKKSTFTGNGHTFTFQLPSKWQETTDGQNLFGPKTRFSAEDTKSHSTMFVQVDTKEGIDFTTFGEKKQAQLKTLYNYKDDAEVYYKAFKVNDKNAYKYTIFTTYDKRDVWGHLYIIETESSMVQFMFYSEDNGDYKKRAERIDESVKTLLETGVSEETESTNSSETTEAKPIETDAMILTIGGYRVFEADNQQYVAVKYSVQNKSTEPSNAETWGSKIKAVQGETTLTSVPLPEKGTDGILKSLAANSATAIEKDQTIESLLVYPLKNTTDQVSLEFPSEVFGEASAVIMDIAKQATSETEEDK